MHLAPFALLDTSVRPLVKFDLAAQEDGALPAKQHARYVMLVFIVLFQPIPTRSLVLAVSIHLRHLQHVPCVPPEVIVHHLETNGFHAFREVFLPVVPPTAQFVLPESTLRLPSKLAVLVKLDMLAFPLPLARYLVLPVSTVLLATRLAKLVLLAARAPKPRQRPLLALPDSTHLETAQCARIVPLASTARHRLLLL